MIKNAINMIRKSSYRKRDNSFLISNLNNTLESKDRYTVLNCDGFGRIRYYKTFNLHLSNNFIPVKPLFRTHKRELPFKTQVFQIMGCSWRCWYCFVDYRLLGTNQKSGYYFTADDLVHLYMKNSMHETDIIDLSGGQPELIPEWCLNVAKSLDNHGLSGKVHLWMDDSLSSFNLWSHIPYDDVKWLSNFPLHSRSCCLKGYNQKSFNYNTNSDGINFDKQILVLRKLIKDKFDVYVYVVFTTPCIDNIKNDISIFIEKLIDIHPLLPLRTIPVKIKPFSATTGRDVNNIFLKNIDNQEIVFDLWSDILYKKYSSDMIYMPYESIDLHN